MGPLSQPAVPVADGLAAPGLLGVLGVVIITRRGVGWFVERLVSADATAATSRSTGTHQSPEVHSACSSFLDNDCMRSFDDLVAEADQVAVEGWDFSWLDGRATEERPPWAYARNLASRLRQARVAVDLQTGGGEVLGEAGAYPPVAVATEAWPPNLAVAAARLRPLGVVVIGHDGRSSLPFADRSFDLITSRHPVRTEWAEIARVLAPGGTYFSQQVGPASMVELSEAFLGPLPDADRWRRPEDACAAAEACGLEVVDLRAVRLRAEFQDIGTIIYVLRKCVWWVPGFSVERYLDTLRELHRRITSDRPFVAHSSRFLIEARRPLRN